MGGFITARKTTTSVPLIGDLVTRKIVSVPSTATLAVALSQMDKSGRHELPVMDGKKLKGWVSYRTLLRRARVSPSSKITAFIDQRPALAADASVYEAAELMIRSNLRAVAVTNGAKAPIAGVLTRSDLLRVVAQESALADTPLEAAMNAEIETVLEDEPLDRAVHTMREHHIGQLLVVDEKGHLAGYAALEDLLRAIAAEHFPDSVGRRETVMGAQPRRAPAVTIQAFVKEAPVLAPTDSIRDAAGLMLERKTNFVAVAEGNIARGILSRANLIERLANLKPSPGVVCQITGLADEVDQPELDHIYNMAEATLNKIKNGHNIEFLSLHYKVYKAKAEGDQKYSLSLHLGTDGRFIVQKADAWNAVDATRAALDLLEQRISEQKKILLDRRKAGSRRKAEFYTSA